MRIAMGVFLVSSVVLAVGAGCSSSSEPESPFGQEPDFNSIGKQFETPTGTYDPKSSGPVLAAYGDEQEKQKNSGGFAAAFGGSGSGTSTQSYPALPEDSAFKCDAMQKSATGTCPCPKGGNFTYDYSGTQQASQSSGIVDVTLKYRWAACGMEKALIDGSMFLNMRSDRAKPADSRQLVVLKMKVKQEAIEASIDLSYALMNGKYWFVVKSGDGYVAVSGQGYSSATKTGTITIKDKNDTYTCTFTNGKGTCKGEKSTTPVEAS